MKKFLKKYNLLIIIGIILIIIGAFLITMGKSLFPSLGFGSTYGNRLEGIEKVSISDKKVNELKELVAKDETYKSIAMNISGKIVNIMVDFKKDTTIDKQKEVLTSCLEKFSAKEKEYYDFQFYGQVSEVADSIPVIGYKNKTSEIIVWSRMKQV